MLLHLFTTILIDSIQSNKKTFVHNVVSNKKLASILDDFIDAQTKYTKSAADSGIKTITELYSFALSDNFFWKKAV